MCCKNDIQCRVDAIRTKNLHLLKGYNASKLIQKFSGKGFQQMTIFSQNCIVCIERYVYNTQR